MKSNTKTSNKFKDLICLPNAIILFIHYEFNIDNGWNKCSKKLITNANK